MQPKELKSRLRGVLAFSPTPFTADDHPDLDGLAAHIDFLVSSGVHVVVVCGGAGEFYALDPDEYHACIRTAVEAAAGRVPVLAGIGHSTRTACGLAEYAAHVGVDGLMITPLYFVNPSPEGLVAHYRAIADAAGLGMLAYSTHGSVYTPDLLARLAEVDAVIALKDEYGDLRLFSESVERLGDRLVWINGMAELMLAPYLAAGAQAMTSGIVNIDPQLTLDVWNLGVAGRLDDLRALIASRVRPLARLRERRKGYHIAVVKEAMNLLGRPGGALRLPLLPVEPPDREELRTVLIDSGILTPALTAP